MHYVKKKNIFFFLAWNVINFQLSSFLEKGKKQTLNQKEDRTNSLWN